MEPAEVTRGGSQVGHVVWQCGRKGPWPGTDGNLGSEHVTWAAVSVDRRARQRPGQGWGLSPHLTSKLLRLGSQHARPLPRRGSPAFVPPPHQHLCLLPGPGRASDLAASERCPALTPDPHCHSERSACSGRAAWPGAGRGLPPWALRTSPVARGWTAELRSCPHQERLRVQTGVAAGLLMPKRSLRGPHLPKAPCPTAVLSLGRVT